MSKVTEFISTSQPKDPKAHIALIILSVICIVIGIFTLCFMNYKFIKNSTIDYTHCNNSDLNECMTILKNNTGAKCKCYLGHNITTDLNKPVFLSYSLTGYHMFNDEYFNSRDENQLKGNLSLTPSAKCGKYTYAEGKPIAPCGAVANSKFNDTITIYDNSEIVPMIYTGLVSEDDKAKYKNPAGDLKAALANFSKPIDWQMNVWNLSRNYTYNNGFENEAFITWMEREHTQDGSMTDKLPLYARIDHTNEAYADGLHAKSYIIRISYNYPVPDNGRKSFVLWYMGRGRSKSHLVIGIIFLIVGLISLAFYLSGWFLRKAVLTQDTHLKPEESYLNE